MVGTAARGGCSHQGSGHAPAAPQAVRAAAEVAQCDAPRSTAAPAASGQLPPPPPLPAVRGRGPGPTVYLEIIPPFINTPQMIFLF
eukprot:gene11944-biopygen10952